MLPGAQNLGLGRQKKVIDEMVTVAWKDPANSHEKISYWGTVWLSSQLVQPIVNLISEADDHDCPG